MQYPENLKDFQSGKLTVICLDRIEQKYYKCNNGQVRNIQYWKCQCECGNISFVDRASITSKRIKSCGCGHGNKKGQSHLQEGEAAWNRYIDDYKRNCKRKVREFQLSIEEFKSICLGNCVYCGMNPSKIYPPSGRAKSSPTKGLIYVNGVDRIDSSKHYFKENCVSCCSICNQAKRNMSLEEWQDWIDRIVLFNKGNL